MHFSCSYLILAETTLDAPPITESEDRGQLPTVEESDDPTLDVAEKSGVDPCSNLNVKLDDQRYSRGSITESNVNGEFVGVGASALSQPLLVRYFTGEVYSSRALNSYTIRRNYLHTYICTC